MKSHQLKETRKRLGLSAEEFADILKVTRSTYYNRESGAVQIRGDFALLVWYVERDLLARGKRG